MLICALLIQISKCSEVVNAEPPDYGKKFDNLSNLGYDIVHFDDRALMVSFDFFISPQCGLHVVRIIVQVTLYKLAKASHMIVCKRFLRQ